VGFCSPTLDCGGEVRRPICQRRSCRRDRIRSAMRTCGIRSWTFMPLTKSRGGTDLPAVHRAHQQLRRSEVATRTATCVVAGTTRIVGGRTVGRKPLTAPMHDRRVGQAQRAHSPSLECFHFRLIRNRQPLQVLIEAELCYNQQRYARIRH